MFISVSETLYCLEFIFSGILPAPLSDAFDAFMVAHNLFIDVGPFWLKVCLPSSPADVSSSAKDSIRLLFLLQE